MMNLEDFTAREVVDEAVWQEWCIVRSAPKPDDRWLPPELHAKRDPALRTLTFQGPTPEYARKRVLSQELPRLIYEKLGEGCWSITGRVNAKPPRVEIELRDVASSDISLADNRIGIYQDVEISRIAVSPHSFLQQQIEAICRRVTPADRLKREIIAEILAALFPDRASTVHFNAAWKEADIGDEWRKAGRRAGS